MGFPVAEKREGKEKVLVLVKALPVVGVRHGETVCCAGVTPEHKWRRQFPIAFRDLGDQTFSRWNWIEYRWRKPKGDDRPESQRVIEGSIKINSKMPRSRRERFLSPMIRTGVDDAEARGETLTLIRPKNTEFYYNEKSKGQIEKEAKAYDLASRQHSLFSSPKKPLAPCPYEFGYKYKTEDGRKHENKCLDWETSATFWNVKRRCGNETRALQETVRIFGENLPERGIVFALGTHHVYGSWLLVGVIRLDEYEQLSML